MKTGDRKNNGVIAWIHNSISYRFTDSSKNIGYPHQMKNVRFVKSKKAMSVANNEFTVVIDPDGKVEIFRSQDGIQDTSSLESLAEFNPKGMI